MKSGLFILILCLSLPAMGDVIEPTKLKITCSAKWKYKVYNPKGELIQDENQSGKISESIRTTWMDGETEVRSSKSKSFSDDGKTLKTISRSVARVTKVTNADGTITEKSESTGVTIRQDDITYGNSARSKYNEWKTESTYRQVGSVKTTLKSVTNGEEDKAGGTETETVISPDLKFITVIEPAHEVTEKDGTRVVSEQNEMNCAFETVKKK